MIDRQQPVIVGVGMTPFGKHPGLSLADLATAAVKQALEDARLPVDAIDAVFAGNSAAGILTGQESVRGQVSLKSIGLRGVPLFNVENACATGSSALHLAVNYIRAGAARCVLVLGYEKMTTEERSRPMQALEACSDVAELADLRARLGPESRHRSIFMDFYAEKIRSYFDHTGADVRHLAWIAAKNHSAGALNPNAQFRKPQTVDSVLSSRTIVAPLTLLMCSPISDGAAALVLVAPEFARSQSMEGPRVAATVFATDSLTPSGSQMRDLALRGYGAAGISPADIDVVELHDATAAAELFEYENLGLAPPGMGWKLTETGETALGGRVPVNPSGGLLARGHPLGATGVAQLCELTWQLRGSAGERQVKGARVGVAQCAGGQTSFGKTSGAAAMSLVVLCS
jgi:acetyl-CoA acetyltransferase